MRPADPGSRSSRIEAKFEMRGPAASANCVVPLWKGSLGEGAGVFYEEEYRNYEIVPCMVTFWELKRTYCATFRSLRNVKGEIA